MCHILSSIGITRASGAASALASSLSNLTALRILDLSGAHALVVLRIPTHAHPGNDITGLLHSEKKDPEEVVASIAPFLPSFARLHDLESLNLSSSQASAFVKIHCASVLCFLFNRRVRRLWIFERRRCTHFERAAQRVQPGCPPYRSS